MKIMIWTGIVVIISAITVYFPFRLEQIKEPLRSIKRQVLSKF